MGITIGGDGSAWEDIQEKERRPKKRLRDSINDDMREKGGGTIQGCLKMTDQQHQPHKNVAKEDGEEEYFNVNFRSYLGFLCSGCK